MHAQNDLLPLVEAVLKATGHRPHLSTVIRWRTRGSRGIRLDASLIGSRWFTTIEKVRAFVEATNRTIEPAAPISTPRQAVQAAERSAKQLAKRLGTAS